MARPPSWAVQVVTAGPLLAPSGVFHAWELNKNSQLVADLSLDMGMLQDVLSSKL